MELEVLVPLVTYPDANSDKVTSNAIAIAKHLDANVHALALNVDIPNVSSVLSGVLLDVPGMIRKAEADSQNCGRALLAGMTTRAAEAGVAVRTGEIATGPAEFGNAAALEARYHDLSLIGWERGNQSVRMVAEAVVFGSGRPVVLLPDVADVGPVDRVMIAWDGSRAAARALADARPFLKRAEWISVVTVLDEKPIHEKESGERLASNLKRRGFAAEAISIHAEDCPMGETLQSHALAAGAKLLVMGGYGHSRIRDFVLGGATEFVLDDLRLPVLVSH